MFLKKMLLVLMPIFLIIQIQAQEEEHICFSCRNKEKNFIQYSLAYLKHIKNIAQAKIYDKKEEIECQVKKKIAIAISIVFDYVEQVKNKFYDGVCILNKKVEELHDWSKKYQ